MLTDSYFKLARIVQLWLFHYFSRWKSYNHEPCIDYSEASFCAIILILYVLPLSVMSTTYRKLNVSSQIVFLWVHLAFQLKMLGRYHNILC